MSTGLDNGQISPYSGNPMTNLSNRLEAARRAKGVSIADLADAAGISARHMRRYLTGASTPPVDVARRIADTLGCSLDELFPSEAVA